MFEGNAEALKRLALLNPLCMESEEDGGGGKERATGKRTTAGGGKSVQGSERLGGEWAMEANPAWIAKRLERLDRIKAKNAAAMAALEKPAITVTLPDGKQMPGVAWETTPLDIAGALSKGLMQAVCVASVRYSNRLKGVTEIIEMATGPDDDAAAVEESLWETWDASRALEGDCELQLLKFDDPRGKEVFWHSTAHMLGQVCSKGGGRRAEGGGWRVGRREGRVEEGAPSPRSLRPMCMCMCTAGARDRVLRTADARPAARERLLLRLVPGRQLLRREYEGHRREEGRPDQLAPTLTRTPPTQAPTPTLALALVFTPALTLALTHHSNPFPSPN